MLCLFFLIACKERGTNRNTVEMEETTDTVEDMNEPLPLVHEEERLNGTNCANVYAENPNTGRKSNYTLEVVVEDNYLVSILFTDGHLDTSHFEAPQLDDKHQCTLTTDRGYNYRIEILDSNEQCESQEAQEVQCSGITKSGARCKRHTSHPSGKCFQHR